MATTAMTAAQIELISSLSQDEIPIKLRCAICSRLAVNAFRLPCCEQAICETCQSTLPSTCPVCEHSPVAAEDCKPNKSLRTTIKVFLRTEEKKREALRLKEAKDTPPQTPVEPVPTPAAISASVALTSAPVDAAAGTQEIKAELSPVVELAETASAKEPEDIEQLQEAQQDIPQPSIEEIAPGQEPTLEADANQVGDVTPDTDGQKDTGGQLAAEGASQTPAFGAGFGFDGAAIGGFPGMGYGAGSDFNQMQMMMAMQNGMAPSAFGNFPMMGMPGMNMDPMTMQNMLMNGGFGAAGMGMNGMNMGMGMSGFDGGVGGSFNNAWNGQQSWNVGPDNFNPNAAGMGSGDYGANNSGYAPHAAGYNQGNYGRGNHFNDYQNNNFGYRGRGRGRGYGRGGYGYGSHEAFSQQLPQQFGTGNQSNGPISETGSIPAGPKADIAPAGNVDEFGREIRQVSEAKETPTESNEIPKDDTTPTLRAVDGDGTETHKDEPSRDVTDQVDDTAPKPIQTLDEAEAYAFAPSGPNGSYMNTFPGRGGYGRGRGGSFGGMHPPIVKAVDVPINAPTGPKAMREGLPNTSLSNLRGRSFAIAGRAGSSRVNGSTSVAPEPSENHNKEKERSRSKSPSRERSRSRDRKRSRSKERYRHRHRHRSTSLSEDEKETERRRQRRKERRRRREEDGDDHEDTGSGEKAVDEGKGDPVDEGRSRSASPSDGKRSSHRSRRDKDKYRERERDSDREHRSSHKHRSSHRLHRDDKSRSPDRDRERDRSDRDRDREHRHRHSRRGSEDIEETTDKIDKSVPATPIEAENPSRRHSVMSNGTNGIEIKGSSLRRKNTIDEVVIPTGPRSSRDREREKEKSTRHHREEEDPRHRSSRHRDSDREKEKDKERERIKDKENPKAAPTAPAVQNPHELEREARNRERLLKEAQRMAGLTAVGGRKRSRDDGDELSAARRGKKKGRRSGILADESDEQRIARLEAERESARWG